MVDGLTKDNSFDLMTFRDISTFEMEEDDGKVKVLQCNERYHLRLYGFLNPWTSLKLIYWAVKPEISAEITL